MKILRVLCLLLAVCAPSFAQRVTPRIVESHERPVAGVECDITSVGALIVRDSGVQYYCDTTIATPVWKIAGSILAQYFIADGTGTSADHWLLTQAIWDAQMDGNVVTFEPGYYEVAHGEMLAISDGTQMLCEDGAIFTYPSTQNTTSDPMFLADKDATFSIDGCRFEPGITIVRTNTCQTPRGVCAGGARDTLPCDQTSCTSCTSTACECCSGGTCSTAGRDTQASTYLEVGQSGESGTATMRLTDNYFDTNRRYTTPGGFHIIIYVGLSESVIEGNTFKMSYDAIRAHDSDNVANNTWQNVRVTNNIFDGESYSSSPCGQYGNALYFAQGAGSNEFVFNNIVISGNTIGAWNAAYDQGGTGTGIIFKDNIINSAGGIGIRNSTAGFNQVSVTGNMLVNGSTMTLTDQDGLVIANNSVTATASGGTAWIVGGDNIFVIGNYYDANWTSSTIYAGVQASGNNIVIANNLIKNISDGMNLLANSSKVIFANNTLSNDTASVGAYLAVTGAYTCTDCVAYGNRAVGQNLTGAWADAPTVWALYYDNHMLADQSAGALFSKVGVEDSSGDAAALVADLSADATWTIKDHVAEGVLRSTGSDIHWSRGTYSVDSYGTIARPDSSGTPTSDFINPEDVYDGLYVEDDQGISNRAEEKITGSGDVAVYTQDWGFDTETTAVWAIKVYSRTKGADCEILGHEINFTGSGLNDATTSVGTYSGTGRTWIEVQIDATGSPDTFKWRAGGGWTTGVSINVGSGNLITDDIRIWFAANTGHTLNDLWTITYYEDSEVNMYYCDSGAGCTPTTLFATRSGLYGVATGTHADVQDIVLLPSTKDPNDIGIRVSLQGSGINPSGSGINKCRIWISEIEMVDATFVSQPPENAVKHPLIPDTSATTMGPMFWGYHADTAYDTGDELCAQIGLTCYDAWEEIGTTVSSSACATVQTTNFAAMCYE